MSPESLLTARLILRPPMASDAEAIFARYGSDPEVTRFLSWPTHRSIDDTRAFLEFCDAERTRWPVGPLLVFSKQTGELLGSTGLAFETPCRASTGYVFAKDAWGHGYATESLQAMCDLAPTLGVRRLYALCYVDHRASARVMEKCGFVREGLLRRHTVFPNIQADEPLDALIYARVW